MTLFGKSLFESVLAGLDAREQDEADSEQPVAHGIRGLNGGFVGRASYFDSSDEADPTTLFGLFPSDDAPAFGDGQLPEPSAARPWWLDRLSEAEIAADLGLAESLTARQLRERRRLFARENHPDRVAPEYRAIATLRMTIANQLTDRALAAQRRR